MKMSYKIKTENFNIFTGTRAESIVDDLGDNKRIVAGKIPFVLPTIATLKDLNNVGLQKRTPVEVVFNSLQPESILNNYFSEESFFYGMLAGMYNVDLAEKPRSNDPIFLVVDMIKQDQKIEKGFRAEERYERKITDTLKNYCNSPAIFTYSGKVHENPSSLFEKELSEIAKESYLVNTKGHNPFFNSYINELIEDTGCKELVIMGRYLEDRVFYSAVNAKDFSKEVTILPEMVVPRMKYGKVVDDKKQGKDILLDHFARVLDVKPVSDDYLAQKAQFSGVTVFLD